MEAYFYSGLFRMYSFAQFWKGFKAINGILKNGCFFFKKLTRNGQGVVWNFKEMSTALYNCLAHLLIS